MFIKNCRLDDTKWQGTLFRVQLLASDLVKKNSAKASVHIALLGREGSGKEAFMNGITGGKNAPFTDIVFTQYTFNPIEKIGPEDLSLDMPSAIPSNGELVNIDGQFASKDTQTITSWINPNLSALSKADILILFADKHHKTGPTHQKYLKLLKNVLPSRSKGASWQEALRESCAKKGLREPLLRVHTEIITLRKELMTTNIPEERQLIKAINLRKSKAAPAL